MLDPHAFDLVGAGEQILDSYLAGLAPFGPTSPAPAQRNEKQAAPSQPSVPSKARARRAAVAVSLAQRRVPGPAR